jgi:hypothetical protein
MFAFENNIRLFPYENLFVHWKFRFNHYTINLISKFDIWLSEEEIEFYRILKNSSDLRNSHEVLFCSVQFFSFNFCDSFLIKIFQSIFEKMLMNDEFSLLWALTSTPRVENETMKQWNNENKCDTWTTFQTLFWESFQHFLLDDFEVRESWIVFQWKESASPIDLKYLFIFSSLSIERRLWRKHCDFEFPVSKWNYCLIYSQIHKFTNSHENYSEEFNFLRTFLLKFWTKTEWFWKHKRQFKKPLLYYVQLNKTLDRKSSEWKCKEWLLDKWKISLPFSLCQTNSRNSSNLYHCNQLCYNPVVQDSSRSLPWESRYDCKWRLNQ